MIHPRPIEFQNHARRGRACWMGLWIVCWGVLLPRFTAIGAEPKTGAAEPLTFEQHVRPILKAHCFDCHGEGDSLRGGLDLRLVRFMIRGGESGAALSPGNPDSSPIYSLAHAGKMPKRDRKPAATEIETLRQWIADGAKTARPEPESLAPGMQITAEEAAHWAFQPIRRPAIPATPSGGAARNSIDAFLLAALRPKGLALSPEAPRRTLIRRLYFDLWGVPPSPADVEAFVADPRPEAYDDLVDRLLASPRYGERWARHWLDIAGYADSEGYTADDTPRPQAYKYRDYVIRALNDDLPIDRFLTEQLAGDELALARHGSIEKAVQDPESRDWIVATGFLRMAADGTATGGIDQDMARNQTIADTLKIVSTSLLGLSVGCAQCHDHRYDPIPHADYYRLRAVFEPAYDWKQWRTPPERRISLYTQADRETAVAVEAEAAALGKEKEAKQTAYIDDALKKHLEKMDPALRDALWTAFHTPEKDRTDEQRTLLKANPSANIHPGVLYQYNPKAAEDLKAMDARIAQVRERKPVEDFVSALWEPGGELPVTYRFHRGDPKQPKEAVAPGTLSVLCRDGQSPALPAPACAPKTPSSGRRLAFAQWLTSDANPLLPRVFVNRVWLHHFGRGLVGTPSDFGMQGEKPTHPELLDWLSATFTAPATNDPNPAGYGWSLKKLHRLILTSNAYRQSSTRRAEHDELDPENRLYGRRSLVRLDAETLRDAYLSVGGTLSARMFGTPVPVREDVVGQIVVGIDKKEGDNKMPVEVPIGEDEFRRSVYVEARRSKPLAFLNTFDAPVMEVNCERRQSSTVATQSLMLMNSDFALLQARRFADRLQTEAGSDPELRVRRAWHLAYGRFPSRAESDAALSFLARQTRVTAETPTGPETSEGRRGGRNSSASNTAAKLAPEDQALVGLCQALMSSNEFLYID
ncbi:MAG: PSD1 domain-containing protein [Verrucomicrobiales bacterium]|nr:PSD1 domain-containing protein [Verrucomicrobiales bacterium]